MAISGIENINIGLQNEAAGSDSLFTAFHKSQNNFTTLFSCASPTTNFVAGDGVAVEYSNSNTYLTITNTGVTNLVAGDDSIVLTQSNGNITITAPGGGNGGGGVSNINVIGAASGARITSTGGPIISSGIITLDLATSGVTAGTYTYPTLTVDQYGRVTSIANAASTGTVTSVGVTTTGVGLQISGSPVTTAGNISIINTGVTRLNAGSGISLSSSNGNITVSTTTAAAGVTSVGLSSTSLDVTNSPITSTGTMTVDLPTNTSIVGNLSVGGNLTVSGNIVSSANVIGTLTANNLSVSGASSGNSNVSTVTGNLGLRTLASTYTDNVSAAGTIAKAAIHAIDIPTLAASNAVTFTNAASFYIAGGPAAGTNATIGTGYALYVNSGNTYFGGANNYIAGNLTVTGNTTYYNVDSFNVQDPIVSLGGGANGVPLSSNDGKDRGVALQYYTTTPVTAFMGWDNGNGEFSFGSNVSIASEVVTYNNLGNARGLTWLGNVVGTTANLTAGNMTTGNITTINSGLIQNGNSNITIAANANISHFVTGNPTSQLTVTATGANIPGYANVVGNANVGNLGTATAIITTGNITTINSGLLQNGSSNISITANANVAIAATGANRLVLTSTGANITGYANVSGNLSAGNIPIIASGNSNITITSNANISMFTAGNATAQFVVATTGVNVAGYANVVGNITAGNIPLVASGNSNITLTSNGNISMYTVGNATAQFVVATTGVNVAGYANVVGNITAGNLIGPLANGNSNVYIATAAGNVTIAATGNTVMTIANTGVSVNGYAAGYSISSTQLGTPATPSGVGSATGGTLAAATYYFKIVAVDGFGQVTAPSTESTGVTTTGATSSIAVSWTATAAATSYRIYFATTSQTYTLGYFTSTTNSFTLTTTAGSTAGTIPVNNTTGSITANGFLLSSVGTGISAAGTAQANATVLTKELNQVTTVAAGSGVVLPQPAAAGMKIFVRNAQAVNALLVYPAANGTINLGAANAALSLSLSTGNTFVCVSASPAPGGTWYTAM